MTDNVNSKFGSENNNAKTGLSGLGSPLSVAYENRGLEENRKTVNPKRGFCLFFVSIVFFNFTLASSDL